MAKLILFLAIAALFVAVECVPYRYADVASAAAADNWDEVHRLLGEVVRKLYNLKAASVSDIQWAKQQQAAAAASPWGIYAYQ